MYVRSTSVGSIALTFIFAAELGAQPMISAAALGSPGARDECRRDCRAEAKRLVAQCIEDGGNERECFARGPGPAVGQVAFEPGIDALQLFAGASCVFT